MSRVPRVLQGRDWAGVWTFGPPVIKSIEQGGDLGGSVDKIWLFVQKSHNHSRSKRASCDGAEAIGRVLPLQGGESVAGCKKYKDK